MTSTAPLISFIIAAYNEERFIADCIDSCLAQTYPNIEVCVTDDGSTDGTWDILAENYGNRTNVKLDKFKNNRGKVFAINHSYKNSQGDYIALMGADDVCFENRIEKSYYFSKEHNCDLVFGKLFYCDEKLLPINYGQRKIRDKIVPLERIIIDNIIGPTYFIRRNMAAKCFPIPETLLFEDWWIGFVAVLYGKAAYVDEYFIKYRQHDQNDNSNIDDRQIVERLKRDFKRHSDYYDCFIKEIEQNKDLVQKTKYLKLIHLCKAHRKIFLEDDFFARIALLPELLKNDTFNYLFFVSLVLMVFGNKFYNLKKLKLIKSILHYSPENLGPSKNP